MWKISRLKIGTTKKDKLQQPFLKMKKLTKYQSELISKLLNGHYISEFRDYSNNVSMLSLMDWGGNEVSAIKVSTVWSLTKKGFLRSQQVYSTTQPDTDTFHHRCTIRQISKSAGRRSEKQPAIKKGRKPFL